MKLAAGFSVNYWFSTFGPKTAMGRESTWPWQSSLSSFSLLLCRLWLQILNLTPSNGPKTEARYSEACTSAENGLQNWMNEFRWCQYRYSSLGLSPFSSPSALSSLKTCGSQESSQHFRKSQKKITKALKTGILLFHKWTKNLNRPVVWW